ncbi:methyltransferase family protein [Pasteurella langaaensis DSM 22999]|uniref:Methyltransferase family protein n=1 Tax=Alitibacter langaaensis DSM 22999 TaxID=1122935 RepID=A0A2U0SN26_9PAST|nr:methyltransferase domain-containing protein [Pasteurella langaaensis]PVX32737.1 methyltransferase family protein [Pasteurella langaaensis DSM 22999]
MKLQWRAKYPHSLSLPTSWQQLPNGVAYSTLLSAYFENWFPRILGRRLLKFGGLSAEIRCETDCQQVLITPETHGILTALCQQQGMILIEDSLQELSFGDGTVDACLLAQTLNFSQDPHQLLREVARVLSDDGYLFLSLFSPCSKLIFKRHLNHFAYRQFCQWRVLDWLELLGFEILAVQPLPLRHEVKWFASQYAIVAQKRTLPLSLQPQKVRFKNEEIFNPAQAFKAPSSLK